MPDAKALTDERHNTHGDWFNQSLVFHNIMEALKVGDNYKLLNPSQQAALINIAQKMSRIVSGDATEPDHWDDIGGYAFLGKGGHSTK